MKLKLNCAALRKLDPYCATFVRLKDLEKLYDAAVAAERCLRAKNVPVSQRTEKGFNDTPEYGSDRAAPALAPVPDDALNALTEQMRDFALLVERNVGVAASRDEPCSICRRSGHSEATCRISKCTTCLRYGHTAGRCFSNPNTPSANEPFVRVPATVKRSVGPNEPTVRQFRRHRGPLFFSAMLQLRTWLQFRSTWTRPGATRFLC
mmetsp:Transcript_16393/g.43950  ORF Transcript_16393/g.43950 Transcript_16393/m.43950 type:complete len:207 (+) Transcript_16393:850-1470(+)